MVIECLKCNTVVITGQRLPLAYGLEPSALLHSCKLCGAREMIELYLSGYELIEPAPLQGRTF